MDMKGETDMPDFRVIVSDVQTGKAYQVEVSDASANTFMGKTIGSEIDGGTVGLPGYTLKITGGSDNGGFPMRRTLPGSKRRKVLVTGGRGFHPDEAGLRKRRSIRGNEISGDIAQINTAVTKYGSSSVASLLGDEPEEEVVEEVEEVVEAAEEAPEVVEAESVEDVVEEAAEAEETEEVAEVEVVEEAEEVVEEAAEAEGVEESEEKS
jgi:small subunit ribosomal protein S6e